MKNSLSIRTIRSGDLEIIYSWNCPVSRGEFQEFNFESFRQLEAEYQKNGFISEQFKSLILERAQKPIGLIFISALRPGLFRLGLVICEATSRKKGVGTKACKMIVQHLFENYPAVRIEADTDVDNISAQRVLEKSGFEREGVLRKYRFHHGKWRDSVLYSIIRSD